VKPILVAEEDTKFNISLYKNNVEPLLYKIMNIYIYMHSSTMKQMNRYVYVNEIVTFFLWKKKILGNTRFKVPILATMKSTIFQDVMSCSPVEVYEHFGGIYCLIFRVEE
jgi:hypothetical protein